MAIVKMNKFNLFSFQSDRNSLLNSLQDFKDVHLNILDKSEDQEYLENIKIPDILLELDEKINNSKWAIDLLKSYVDKKSTVESLKEGNKSITISEIKKKAEKFNFTDNYNKLKELSDEKNGIKQEILNKEANINELNPWDSLNLEIRDLYGLRRVKVNTGTVAIKSYDKLVSEIGKIDLAYLENISSNSNLHYVLIVYDLDVEEEVNEILRKASFTKVIIKANESVEFKITKLKEEIDQDRDRIKEIDNKLQRESENLEDFEIYYDYLRNYRLKLGSSEKFLKTKEVDLIEGYFAEEKKEDFINMLDKALGSKYYIEISPASRDDPKVPIKLSNNRFIKAFEPLTSMYSLPKYNEIDPTPLFAPFYFMFAGIMVGDIAYGFLLFLATLLGKKLFNLDKTKERMVTFFMYLGISAMIWGFVFGSFFGDLLPLKSYINPETDHIEMILMSLAIGGVHIFYALGIKAYMDIRDKKPLDAFFDVGLWYMALLGIIVLIVSGFVGIENPMIKNVAKIITIIGMVGIVLTGGRDQKSIGAKIGWGVYSLYGITSYLGDFVSYIRLMALVLAGTFIAIAVNMIVKMLFSAGPLGIIVGVIVFIIFQLFNMFLSFLSAYVHTARLTYVEMFNKFYEGGGKPFKEMVEESNYFNIIEEE